MRAIQIPGQVDNLPQDVRQIVENRNADYRRTHAAEERLAVAVVNARDIVKPEDIEDWKATCWHCQRKTGLIRRDASCKCLWMKSPFRYFKTSPEIIRLAVMMYVRFPLSLRNVEDLLHERGIEVSHETIRFWWNRFGPIFAAELRKKRKGRMRALSGCRWHLDEVFVKINGERHYLRRAVDQEGEVLEAFVSKKRDRKAALKFLRKLMKRYPRPDAIITDRLRSYRAALRELGGSGRHQAGRWLNNRAENSHLPFRRGEHAMLRFRRMRSLQKFATVHSSVYNHFNLRRSLCSRDNFKLNRAAALAQWRQLGAA